jgi:hypothetical protein
MGHDDTKSSERKGPFLPLLMRAIVRKKVTQEIVAEHCFDFNNEIKRKWFNEKLLIWSLLNKDGPEEQHVVYVVEVMKAEDDQ